jgi:hypothetical protein
MIDAESSESAKQVAEFKAPKTRDFGFDFDPRNVEYRIEPQFDAFRG